MGKGGATRSPASMALVRCGQVVVVGLLQDGAGLQATLVGQFVIPSWGTFLLDRVGVFPTVGEPAFVEHPGRHGVEHPLGAGTGAPDRS